ncbi:MAG: transglycosylase SLT domain-containing protein [Deltaproteobacteria bacterium]|nr:transglycosylase SLT domain-containing protein [Deltaproteobacteria bacterium]
MFSFLGVEAKTNLRHQVSLPFPQELKFKVEFWRAIYTKYSTKQGVLHDAEDLSIIYDAIELPKNGDTAGVDQMRAEIREHLFNILRKRGENLTMAERKLLTKFPANTSRSRLLQATENIRFQLGQSDRFKAGLLRSGLYMKHIEVILAEEGLPDFIKYLPHVESSYSEQAISKFGAAGLWQLMPQTGKQYLRVDYAVDERLDPLLATHAAAKHLARDFQMLGAWPLALTAYNHGAGGISRAVQTLGTTDIAEIAFRFQSPSFGFASRNFYAQFLAAVDVAENYRRYFGELPIPQPIVFEAVTLKEPKYFREFSQNYRVSLEDFKKLNPALRSPVYSNQRPIPRGMLLRVPPHSQRLPELIASLDKRAIPAKAKSAKLPEIRVTKTPAAKDLKPKNEVVEIISPYRIQDIANGKGWITVEINETISQIAEWLGVGLEDLRSWNGMDAQAQTRLGQKLLVKVDRIKVDEFQQVREDYHKKIKEDFFSQYDVASLTNYEVQKGENLWSLCYQKFDLPPWLLQEYNVGVSLVNLAPGTKLKIPVLNEKLGAPMISSRQ